MGHGPRKNTLHLCADPHQGAWGRVCSAISLIFQERFMDLDVKKKNQAFFRDWYSWVCAIWCGSKQKSGCDEFKCGSIRGLLGIEGDLHSTQCKEEKRKFFSTESWVYSKQGVLRQEWVQMLDSMHSNRQTQSSKQTRCNNKRVCIEIKVLKKQT